MGFIADTTPVASALFALLYENPISFVVSLLLSALASKCFYNLYLHPLSGIPGPSYAAISDLYYTYIYFRGRLPHDIHRLHTHHGPIVRVAPSQISFSSATSWRGIYGHVPSRAPMLKSSFYDFDGGAPSMADVRDPALHAEWRKLLSSAFSHRALAEQEGLVQGHVDELVRGIGKRGIGSSQDAVVWFTHVAFDIVGELAFGEDFGGTRSGETHMWVRTVSDGLKGAVLPAALRQLVGGGWVGRLVMRAVVPRKNVEARKMIRGFCEEKLRRRMEMKTDKKDFMSYFLQDNVMEKMGFDLVVAQALAFVTAGSDTSSDLLSSTVFYLCKHPDIYKRLNDCVRTAFPTYESITNIGVMGPEVAYFRAVMSETMRLHPPAPLGLPRVSNGQAVDGVYLPEGTVCFTSSFAACRSPENFTDPEKFDPTRWTGENPKYKNDKRDASAPFSIGPRNCIGINLALMEARLILAKLFWVFDIELVDPEENWHEKAPATILWTKPPLNVRFSRRPGVVVPPIDDCA